MTASTFPRFLTGLAVPYGDQLIRHENDYGAVVRQRFDRGSVKRIDPAKIVIPLLVEHDWDYPIGKVTRLVDSPDGLVVEARLFVPLHEHTTPDQRSLSMGFDVDRSRDRCRYTLPYGFPPEVVRRGVDLYEVSVCRNPAYQQARILKLSHTDPHPPPPPPETALTRIRRKWGDTGLDNLRAMAASGVELSRIAESAGETSDEVAELLPADSETMRRHRWEQQRLELQLQRFNSRHLERRLDKLGIRPAAQAQAPRGTAGSTESNGAPQHGARQIITRYFPTEITIG